MALPLSHGAPVVNRQPGVDPWTCDVHCLDPSNPWSRDDELALVNNKPMSNPWSHDDEWAKEDRRLQAVATLRSQLRRHQEACEEEQRRHHAALAPFQDMAPPTEEEIKERWGPMPTEEEEEEPWCPRPPMVPKAADWRKDDERRTRVARRHLVGAAAIYVHEGGEGMPAMTEKEQQLRYVLAIVEAAAGQSQFMDPWGVPMDLLMLLRFVCLTQIGQQCMIATGEEAPPERRPRWEEVRHTKDRQLQVLLDVFEDAIACRQESHPNPEFEKDQFILLHALRDGCVTLSGARRLHEDSDEKQQVRALQCVLDDVWQQHLFNGGDVTSVLDFLRRQCRDILEGGEGRPESGPRAPAGLEGGEGRSGVGLADRGQLEGRGGSQEGKTDRWEEGGRLRERRGLTEEEVKVAADNGEQVGGPSKGESSEGGEGRPESGPRAQAGSETRSGVGPAEWAKRGGPGPADQGQLEAQDERSEGVKTARKEEGNRLGERRGLRRGAMGGTIIGIMTEEQVTAFRAGEHAATEDMRSERGPRAPEGSQARERGHGLADQGEGARDLVEGEGLGGTIIGKEEAKADEGSKWARWALTQPPGRRGGDHGLSV